MWGRLHSCRLQPCEESHGWIFRGCAGGRKVNCAGKRAVRGGSGVYLHFWKLNYMRGGLLPRCDKEGRVSAQGIYITSEPGRTVLPGVCSRVLPRQVQT